MSIRRRLRLPLPKGRGAARSSQLGAIPNRADHIAKLVEKLGKARQHLQGFLLRHCRVHPGKRGWTLAYRRWLTTVRFEHPAQQVVLQDYIHAVTPIPRRGSSA